MSADAFERALAAQLEVGQTLNALLRLAEMEQSASTPDAWDALIACKQREIDALASKNFPELVERCRDLLVRPDQPASSRLAGLIERNRDMLVRICALERRAMSRAEHQCNEVSGALASSRVNKQLDSTYSTAVVSPPKFLDQIR